VLDIGSVIYHHAKRVKGKLVPRTQVRWDKASFKIIEEFISLSRHWFNVIDEEAGGGRFYEGYWYPIGERMKGLKIRLDEYSSFLAKISSRPVENSQFSFGER